MQTFTEALASIETSVRGIFIDIWYANGAFEGIIWERITHDGAGDDLGIDLASFTAAPGESLDDMAGRIRQYDWAPDEWIHYDFGGGKVPILGATR